MPRTGASLAVAALFTLGTSGAAFADSDVTWTNASTKRCLEYSPGFSNPVVADCSRGWKKIFHDTGNADGSWNEVAKEAAPFGKLCLAAYKDNSVYIEPCTNPSNDYQRWFENKTDTGWELRHKATGRCLDSNAEGKVYLHDCNAGLFQRWT
ncbi:RICIN domain-containing protein [Kitasatospora sp. NPDC089797]|uniref:RICIN domain-containing protein n=1 Tax=Kitasatospora sp. NPDC089797 TaxID=3155298 RepID=UPI0034176223